jgi:nitrogen fixation/metabolism regulation signal transduction histidine kinase
MLRDYLPVGVCLLLLVPVIAWDAIRFTHRLVGPMVRFRNTMQTIAEGETVRPIRLREGDYLTDLRDDFNHMLESLQRRGVPVLKPAVPVEDEAAQSKPA